MSDNKGTRQGIPVMIQTHLHIKTFPPSDLKKLLSQSQSQEIRNKSESRKQNPLLSFYFVTGFCDIETETSDKINIVT